MSTATFGSVTGAMALATDDGTDAMTERATRRPWRTRRLEGQLVGIKGAAHILGVDKSTVHQWLKPGSGELGPEKTYMIPPARVDGEFSTGKTRGWPVWFRADVEYFEAEIGRQRAPKGEAKSQYVLRRAARRSPEDIEAEIAVLHKQLEASRAAHGD